MTTVVTRYDFGKNISKYMKMAETQTVIIIRNKLAGWETGWVLLTWEEYSELLEKKTGVKL